MASISERRARGCLRGSARTGDWFDMGYARMLWQLVVSLVQALTGRIPFWIGRRVASPSCRPAQVTHSSRRLSGRGISSMHVHDCRPDSAVFRLTPLAGLLVLLAAAPGLAQSQTQTQNSHPAPELITDRPDFTESSEVVGRGVVQLESGLTFASRMPAVRQVTLPELLVRIGLGDRVELRLAQRRLRLAVAHRATGSRTARRASRRRDRRQGEAARRRPSRASLSPSSRSSRSRPRPRTSAARRPIPASS